MKPRELGFLDEPLFTINFDAIGKGALGVASGIILAGSVYAIMWHTFAPHFGF